MVPQVDNGERVAGELVDDVPADPFEVFGGDAGCYLSVRNDEMYGRFGSQVPCSLLAE